MKIALLNNLYEPFNRGGAEKVVSLLAQDFINQGHEVFIITTRPINATEPKIDSLKVYYLPSRYYDLNRLSKMARFFWQVGNVFDLVQTKKVKAILKKEKPDLISTHNLMGLSFLTPRLIRCLKIRQEHYLHDIQLLHPSGLMFYGQEKKIDSLSAKFYQLFTRCFFASPVKVISPSEWLMEQYKQRGFFRRSELEVRPFKLAPEQKIVNQPARTSGRHFLYVGQMEDHKGIFLLINAFKKLPDKQAKLIMVGDGTKLSRAKEQASTDQRISFWGKYQGQELEKLMAQSDYLVIPSLCYENSPTTILEAHACGVPVIAARIGGIPEITNRDDKLFEPGNETDLLNKLQSQPS